MIDPALRALIRKISLATPLWGVPRIPSERLKLGIRISPTTVAKYGIRQRRPPSPTWRALLRNHVRDLVDVDVFTVPTASFRRRVHGLGISEVLTAARSAVAASVRRARDRLDPP